MAIALKVMTADGDELSQPYLLRVGGWSEERYFREAPESRFVEFEDGEVIVHSPASPRHQLLTVFLTMLLRGYVRSRRLGEVLNGPAVVRLRPGLNYEPDIFFIPLDRLAGLGGEYFAGTPGLIVEVVSQGTRMHDLRTKASAYQQYGVGEYWVLDWERKVVLRHLLPADPRAPYQVDEYTQGRLESQAIPGFWFEVSWLWEDPLPDELRCVAQILAP